jgi:hypothetical protein
VEMFVGVGAARLRDLFEQARTKAPFVRRYIHENTSYRFAMLPDGAAAYALEAAIKSSEWHGRPLPNPGR